MTQTESDQQWSLFGHERPFRIGHSKFLNGRIAARSRPLNCARSHGAIHGREDKLDATLMARISRC